MSNIVKTGIYLLVLFFIIRLSAQEKVEGEIVTDSLFSKELNEWRKIKVYLPKDYNSEQKYPVCYSLDADWMFKPVVSETGLLSNFEVIPPVIVVGVFQKDRISDLNLGWKSGAYTQSSLKFRNFLVGELVPYIDKRYATSGFNFLVGHSNSASYVQKVFTEKKQPFQGVIALSQNLFGSQWDELNDFITRKQDKPYFYFVASGTQDADMRLETGLKLDSIFKSLHDPNLVFKQQLYQADHSGVAARGINDGIAHTFSLYKHLNDWDEKLIDSLVVHQINGQSYLEEHADGIHKIYGIDYRFNKGDLDFLLAMIQNKKDVVSAMDFERKHYPVNEHFYATYAQIYEYIKAYDKALEFWKKNLENQQAEHNAYLFYYRRPIELLYKKMDKPEVAIDFALEERKKYPERRFFFDYMIAKVAVEKNIMIKEGLKAIADCKKNYRKNRDFNLEDIEKLEQKLKNELH